MVSKEAAKSLFGSDLYIVSTLLDKLSHHQVEKWIEFAENQNDIVESGRNEWEVFRAWLLQGYRLAKRARITVAPSPRQQTAPTPVRPVASSPVPQQVKSPCSNCRMMG